MNLPVEKPGKDISSNSGQVERSNHLITAYRND